MRFDEPTRQRLRRQLLDRGLVLATLLSEAMSGKLSEARLRSLGIADKPGLRPEERLRLALDQVEARRKLLDAEDDRFGRCDVCAIDLGEAALGEMAWADHCQAHAG